MALLGAALVLGGVAMLPLPGPGWLVIFAGLGVLSVEFAWARGVLAFARAQVSRWTGWVSRQSWPVRALVGGACLLLVVAAVLGVAWMFGVPGWVPDPVASPVEGLLARLP